MTERRNNDRQKLVYYLRVVDRATDTLLGHIIDITSLGIRLVSKQALPVGETFQLKIILPEEIKHKQDLVCEAQSMWCTKDVNPNFYDTGLAITKVTQSHFTVIEQLVQDFGA